MYSTVSEKEAREAHCHTLISPTCKNSAGAFAMVHLALWSLQTLHFEGPWVSLHVER